MVVVDHLVHKYDEILCSVHHGGHPASHAGLYLLSLRMVATQGAASPYELKFTAKPVD